MQGAGKKTASLEPGSELTLAQRYGLVKRPPSLLTKEEWKAVHDKSKAREDSCGECAICREEFKDDDQILLSCSHVFHKQCIDAFERFAKQRCCPLCRSEQYQKKAIEDGKEIYRQKCATRIQANFRGFLVKKAYGEIRRKIPYKDPRLKRRWLEDRIQEQSSALVREGEEERGDLDSFFAELDASVAKSRADVAKAEEALLRCREVPQFDRRSGRAPDSLLLDLNPVAGWDPYRDPSRPADDEDIREPMARLRADASRNLSKPETPVSSPSVNWDNVIARATDRGHSDCPICLGDLHRNGGKGIAWLSCTHCFHVDCIACFEAFELSRGNKTCCPVCRSAYERITL